MQDIEFQCMSGNGDTLNFDVDKLGYNFEAVSISFYIERNDLYEIFEIHKEDVRKLKNWLETFLAESDRV